MDCDKLDINLNAADVHSIVCEHSCQSKFFVCLSGWKTGYDQGSKKIAWFFIIFIFNLHKFGYTPTKLAMAR